MYELYRFGNEWQIHTKDDGAYAGSFGEIMRICMKEMRLPANELEAAVISMERNDHDASLFGRHKSLIYTFDKNPKREN